MLFLSMLVSSLLLMQPEGISNQVKGRSFGELVDAYVVGRKKYADSIYEILTQYVGTDRAVLDVGCGTGLSTEPLFTRGFKEVRGVDHDPKMLAIARRHNGHQDQFDEGSVYQLPYSDGQFGLVTMFSSFHWFCDEKALSEITRVLDKQGFVYVNKTHGRPWKNEVEKIMESTIGHKIVDAHEKYNPEQLLQENGFAIVTLQTVEISYQYTIDEVLQREQSSSSWHDVKRAGKEKEMVAKLKEFFLQLADDQGIIHGLQKTTFLLAQKK